ncbi:MAG: AMP-binding protein [Gemmatimonadota bacterium]|nr:AMP-binding protein [Gemmatimonadota bacterium]
MALSDRFRDLSIAECLSVRAAGAPEHTFVVQGERRLTYQQVDQQSDAFAAALHRLGVEVGDRVAINLPNWPEFVVALFAAAKLGAVVVPLNPRYTTPELQYMLRHSETALAVTAESWGGVDYLARFEGFLSSLPDLQYVVSVGEDDLWYDDRIHQFEDLLSSGEGREFPRAEVSPAEDVFAILYTSGTMGKPKGVALTHTNLLATAVATVEAIGLGSDDMVSGLGCLFNVFGVGPGILGTLAAGGCVVLQEDHDPGGALDLIERERITVHHGVPTSFVVQLREQADAPRDLSSLRTGIVAGAPVSEELVARIQREMVPDVHVGYGLTEAGSTISLTRSDDAPGKRLLTVGRPIDGTLLRVIDRDGSILPEESVGEVAVLGPGVMKGYYRQPGESVHAFSEGGYFLTGDLGMVDEEGYLHIIGRSKEMIIRGGFNVYPREIEDRLHAHPAVQGAAVVGLPDEVLGEMACACIVPVEGAIVTGEEIKEFCREVMADYKVPDLVRFLDSFPMTGSGKVRRVELARMITAEESSRRP